MQITLNQAEVAEALQAHVDTLVNVAGDCHITVNEDGTALVVINEGVSHEDDTPPVVEKKTRRRRNPQEAKHRPVEVEPEAPTSVGGQSETTTPEPKAEEARIDPTEELQEEATAEAEAEEPETASEEAAVEEKVAEQEETKPAAKPSLFAGLKNR